MFCSKQAQHVVILQTAELEGAGAVFLKHGARELRLLRAQEPAAGSGPDEQLFVDRVQARRGFQGLAETLQAGRERNGGGVAVFQTDDAPEEESIDVGFAELDVQPPADRL